MKYLGIEEKKLNEVGGIHTAREIQQQPDVWLKIYDQVKDSALDIKSFMSNTLADVDDIILTGAGTSAYIGETLVNDYKKTTGIMAQAIPTTDIVTHPQNFFYKNRKVLLISFARSGNSPESVASVDLAEKYAETAYQLIITCNVDGALVKNKKANQYSIVLPPETNDESLAMTSSFSGMLVAGLLVSRIDKLEEQKSKLDKTVQYANKILTDFSEELQKLAQVDFSRAIFIGSGPLFGIGVESHLKLQELTDGKVICKNDSYLAFRHGPKAVINDTTLVVFLASNNEYVMRYEKDLIKAVQGEDQAMMLVSVSENKIEGITLDKDFVLSNGGDNVDEEFLSLSSVLPAQILGFFKSINVGLKPDKPSVSGTIARVVEGVTIYE